MPGGAVSAIHLPTAIDPEFRDALDLIPDLDLGDIARARAERLLLAKAARAGTTPLAGIRIEDRRIDGIDRTDSLRIRCYSREREAASPVPALLWMHGGGHVLGTVEQDDHHLARLVSRLDCMIVSVDWRRSPEAPYPAAIDDCYAALAWLFESAGRIGVDPARIAVGGSSSGGGLAAGLCLLAHDRGHYRPCFQWLFYPMLDDRNVTRSSLATTHPKVWNRRSNLIGWAAYLGPLAGRDDVPPYAAPSRARDLAGLPATFLGTGALDLFFDENIEYAQRLIAAEVATELIVYPRAIHGFDLFVPQAAVSRRFVADRTDALRRGLGL